MYDNCIVIAQHYTFSICPFQTNKKGHFLILGIDLESLVWVSGLLIGSYSALITCMLLAAVGRIECSWFFCIQQTVDTVIKP